MHNVHEKLIAPPRVHEASNDEELDEDCGVVGESIARALMELTSPVRESSSVDQFPNSDDEFFGTTKRPCLNASTSAVKNYIHSIVTFWLIWLLRY
jgi:hypothetical protein